VTEGSRPERPDLSGLSIDRDAPAPRGNWPLWRIVLGVVIPALIVAVAINASKIFRPVDVTVAPAVAAGGTPGAAAAASEVLTANGYVVARQRASVSTEVAGRLEALYVGEGSRVKKGQILGVLRNRDQRTAVEAARAALASAKAEHEEAKASLAQSELELKRTAEMKAQGLVSDSQFDAADSKAKVDRARMERTKAGIESAEANRRVAEADLDKTYVRAPFAGAILRKEAEVGEIVSPIPSSGGLTRGAIVTMANLTTLEVEADVNEGYVSRTHEGMRTEITLDAYPSIHFPGHVRQIVPTADRSKATVLVKVGFDSLDARVLPEMGSRVSFLADPAPADEAGGGPGAALSAVVTVPKAAVREADGRTVVFVVSKGRAMARGVSPRPVDADHVAVSSGLAPEEQVIVDAPANLKDGTRVRVRNAPGGSK
jgi:RND family efflux transporter MFP subunit